jgi:hypothetical protein
MFDYSSTLSQILVDANKLTTDSFWTYFKIIIPPLVTAAIVSPVGAYLGYRLAKKSTLEAEERKNIREIHFSFLLELNIFYANLHKIHQDLNSYDILLHNLGIYDYFFDYGLSYNENTTKFKKILEIIESEMVKKSNKNHWKNHQHEQLMMKIKFLSDFNLIINLGETLNLKAHAYSLFIDKSLKIRFDGLIIQMKDFSKDKLKSFYILKFKLEIMGLIEQTRDFIDPKKKNEPLFYEANAGPH